MKNCKNHKYRSVKTTRCHCTHQWRKKIKWPKLPLLRYWFWLQMTRKLSSKCLESKWKVLARTPESPRWVWLQAVPTTVLSWSLPDMICLHTLAPFRGCLCSIWCQKPGPLCSPTGQVQFEKICVRVLLLELYAAVLSPGCVPLLAQACLGCSHNHIHPSCPEVAVPGNKPGAASRKGDKYQDTNHWQLLKSPSGKSDRSHLLLEKVNLGITFLEDNFIMYIIKPSKIPTYKYPYLVFLFPNLFCWNNWACVRKSAYKNTMDGEEYEVPNNMTCMYSLETIAINRKHKC